MTNTFLSIYWGILYAICVALGFVDLPSWVGLVGSVVFFLPPAILLHRAVRAGNTALLRRVRNLSLLWLGVTVLMILLNIFSVALSEAAGTALYAMLIVLSAPMVCSGFWALPIFLWACLLIVSVQQLRKK